MIAPDSLKIIINKGKKEEKFIGFLSLNQIIKMLLLFIIAFNIGKNLLGELEGLVLSVGVVCLFAVMCLDLPDHLNLYEHLKMAVYFYTKQPKNYLYYKEINKPEKEEVVKHEFVQEERIKPVQKTKTKSKSKKSKQEKKHAKH